MIRFPPFFYSLPILCSWSSRSISPQPRPNCTPSGLEKYQLEVALKVTTNVHKDRITTQRDHGRERRANGDTHTWGRSTVPQAGRAPAVMPVGLGTALGRRSCNFSRIQIITQLKSKLFTEDGNPRKFLEF